MLDDDRWKAVTTVGYLAHPETLKHRPCRSHAVNVTMPGDLFDVSRRSVHHWANGKPVTASHDRTIRRMLAAIRHLDRGSQNDTRALLRAVDPATGVSTLDLLKAGQFDEAMGRVPGVRVPEPPRTPLSRAARDARRPPALPLLLNGRAK